ncbi:MAG: hypothetical protein V5A64_05095 [Candidatus Thermoplasmatota archaeon]
MEFELNEQLRRFLSPFLLILLPLILIGLGLLLDIENAWYFILSVTWFSMGVIFQSAIS